MSDDLDSLVKGAPLSGRDAKDVGMGVGASPVISVTDSSGDPTSHSPDSPSMIYLNLLVLEASLRAQYLELRARRRHHTLFLTLLTAWIASFAYALFLAPREDGRGVGGSVYWGIEVLEKVCLLGGVITAVLVWATGIWDRGIRWPRRWFGISNRGLRGFNCKLVVVRRPIWAEAASMIAFFLTNGLFSNTASSSYRHVEPAILQEVERELNLAADAHPTLPVLGEDEERGGHEEDLAPGGDYVKLLLLAKPFSPNFRENWEIYRNEYWDRENERRALIRAKLKERDHRLAKERWGWHWWMPWHRGPEAQEKEKDKAAAAAAAALHAHHHAGAEGEKGGHHPPHHRHGPPGVEKEHRRRGSSVRRGSTSSSRSQTPTLELGEDASVSGTTPGGGAGGGAASGGGVSRKASTASNASDKRRKAAAAKLSSGSRSKRPGGGTDSRSVTPDIPSPLAKESSFGSASGGSGIESGRTLRNQSSRSSVGSARDRAR